MPEAGLRRRGLPSGPAYACCGLPVDAGAGLALGVVELGAQPGVLGERLPPFHFQLTMDIRVRAALTGVASFQPVSSDR